MKIQLILLLVLSLEVHAQTSKISNAEEKILIDAELPPGYREKTIALKGCLAPSISKDVSQGFSVEQSAQEDKSNKWEIPTTKPLLLFGAFIKPPYNILNYVVEPGDNIQITYDEINKPYFAGHGAAKFELVYRLSVVIDSFNKLPELKDMSASMSITNSLQDYLKWNNFLNNDNSRMTSITAAQDIA